MAIALLTESLDRLVMSPQVLGEFFDTATRKLGMSVDWARAHVVRLAPRAKITTDARLVVEAIELCGARSLSYWDALIVVAAARAGCSELLTEDLNVGETLPG